MWKLSQQMLNKFLTYQNKKSANCHVCDGQGWITMIVSKVPLKTVTDSCRQCNSNKIPNPNYRTKKFT